MIKKIKEYLSSDDREMIELGATLLQEKVNPDRWAEILEECLTPPSSNNLADLAKDMDTYLMWGDLPRKPSFQITHDKKIVLHFPPDLNETIKGLWTSYRSTPAPSFTILTGEGGMRMIDAAIKEELEKNNI